MARAKIPSLQFINRGIPLIIAISYCLAAFEPDLRLATPMLVSVSAIVTILLALMLYTGEQGRVRLTPCFILVTAAVFRLLFLFRSPELSDDIYRYLWDGLRILAGQNPYALAPSYVNAHSSSLADLLGHINHANMVTIYPPAAQLVFAAGASLGGNVLGLKILLTGIDLLTCFILIRLLTALALPPWRSILYAWHPLSVLEIAASGHIDGAGLMFFFASVSLLVASRSDSICSTSDKELSGYMPRHATLAIISGLAFACAALVKFLPLAFLPGCLFCLPKRARILFSIGFSTGMIMLAAFFMPDLKNELVTLGVYGRHWEFSGFLFKSLHNLILSGDMVRGILCLSFFIAALFFYKNLWSDRARPGETADASRQIFFQALHTFYAIAMAFLLLAPTLYPWYGLYLVGIFPFAAGSTGLVLAWSVFLSYQVLIPYTLFGQWIEGTWTPAIIWLAPMSAFLFSVLARGLKTGNTEQAKHQ